MKKKLCIITNPAVDNNGVDFNFYLCLLPVSGRYWVGDQDVQLERKEGLQEVTLTHQTRNTNSVTTYASVKPSRERQTRFFWGHVICDATRGNLCAPILKSFSSLGQLLLRRQRRQNSDYFLHVNPMSPAKRARLSLKIVFCFCHFCRCALTWHKS